VLSGSVAERLLTQNGGSQWKSYPGNVETFRDLKVGRLEAVLVDLPIAIHYAKPDAALKLSGSPFAQGYYAIGIRKQDETLLAAINRAIDELVQDHTVERIYKKYNVWDERQAALQDYVPQKVDEKQSGVTFRERIGYLPLLLRAAGTTAELS